MGFFEKLNKQVRSTNANQTTQTIDLEKQEETSTTESTGVKNSEGGFSNITDALSSLTHFWNQITKPKPTDSFSSETSELIDKTKEELATQATDLLETEKKHSFFESMKESLIKGTSILKDSISSHSIDTLKNSSEDSASTDIDDPIDRNSDTDQLTNTVDNTLSYESLKNFFGESINKIKETVSNIDNSAESIGSDKNIANEDTDSTITIEKQTPLAEENLPPLTVESTEEQVDSSLNDLKGFFNKGINVIKQSVNKFDSMANSAGLSKNDSSETFDSNNEKTDNLSESQPIKAGGQETITDPSTTEINDNLETFTQTENESDSIESSYNDLKSFFSKSMDKIKESAQSFDLSDSVDSMKELFDKGMDRIKQPETIETSSDTGIDPIIQSDKDHPVQNESITIDKKENIEQLIADSVTDTQELAQILETGEKENNDSASTEEITSIEPTLDSANSIERLSEKITSDDLVETKSAIPATAVHFITQKMTDANNIGIDSSPIVDSISTKNTVDTENVITTDESTDPLSSATSAQDSAKTLTDTHSNLGHTINLNKPDSRISSLLNQAIPKENNSDQEKLSDSSIVANENNLNSPPLPETHPLNANKTITDDLENKEIIPSEKIMDQEIPSAIQAKSTTEDPVEINVDLDLTKDDSSIISDPDENSIDNDLSVRKENILSENLEKISTSVADKSEIELQTATKSSLSEQADSSSINIDNIALVKPSLLKAEQLIDLEEETGSPLTDEAAVEIGNIEKPNEVINESKSRGIFWGLATLLLTMFIAAGVWWWLTFSENNQQSKDTDFVSFESLAKEESEQQSLNQNDPINNLPSTSNEITEPVSLPETLGSEKLEVTTPIENNIPLSNQQTEENANPVNSSQDEQTVENLIKNKTVSEINGLANKSNIERNNAPLQLNQSALDQTIPDTNQINVTTDTQNSTINDPIANISNFLNSNDGSLPKGFILNGLNFDTASTRISEDSAQIISDLATLLIAHPSIKIRLEGHTDNQGDATKNQRLSARRAQSVKSKLVSLKINPARIRVAGLGEEFPIMGNETTIGRQTNRRVEVIIIDGWFLNLNKN